MLNKIKILFTLQGCEQPPKHFLRLPLFLLPVGSPGENLFRKSLLVHFLDVSISVCPSWCCELSHLTWKNLSLDFLAALFQNSIWTSKFCYRFFFFSLVHSLEKYTGYFRIKVTNENMKKAFSFNNAMVPEMFGWRQWRLVSLASFLAQTCMIYDQLKNSEILQMIKKQHSLFSTSIWKLFLFFILL